MSETTQQVGMLSKIERRRFVRDLTGLRFGKLLVAGFFGGGRRWVCLCDCGNRVRVATCNLNNGHTKSCGCLRAEFGRSLRTHGMKRTRIYGIWSNMVDRCYNRKNKNFHRYGGRGIKVCRRWKSFIYFFKDVGHPPNGKQLDRRENNKGYNPSNCRWVTAKDNCQNKSNNHILAHNGKRMCLSAWANAVGLKPALLGERLRCGWTVKRALETPLNTKYRNHTNSQL